MNNRSRQQIVLTLMMVASLTLGSSLGYGYSASDKIDSTIAFLNEGASAGKISTDIKKSLVDILNLAKTTLAGSDPASAEVSVESALAIVGSSRSLGDLLDPTFANDLEAKLNEIRELI